MRILLIHQNFPGQFRHMAQAWAQRPGWQVVAIGRDTCPGMPGLPELKLVKYRPHRDGRKDQHPYLRKMEDAVLHGQAVARAMQDLKRQGFEPDAILAHPGWGETLYAKDVFPQARLIHLCEWYYSPHGTDVNFDPEFPTTLDDQLRIRTWNALHLLNLEHCDAAISPTQWQRAQHPARYRDKIHVVHEGIPTESLGPDPEATFTIQPPPIAVRAEPPLSVQAEPVEALVDVSLLSAQAEPPASVRVEPPLSVRAEPVEALVDAPPHFANQAPSPISITLRPGDPVITYVARNLEPYRGFPSFMRALEIVQREHPTAQALIVGGDDVSYGKRPTGGAAHWRAHMLAECPRIDPARTHFLGRVPYEQYKRVLQVSAAHVYLTVPFVLSWSMLEAMATGCLVIGSNTPPVREVIEDGVNGLLVDFFNPQDIARQVLHSLQEPRLNTPLRQAARTHAQQHFSLEAGVAAYEDMLKR